MKSTIGIHTPVHKFPKGFPITPCMFLCVSISCKKTCNIKKMLLSTCCSKLSSYLIIVFLVVNLWNKAYLATSSPHFQKENECLRQKPHPNVKDSILLSGSSGELVPLLSIGQCFLSFFHPPRQCRHYTDVQQVLFGREINCDFSSEGIRQNALGG